MKILLTDLAIQKLKWNGTTTVYWDTTLPNFGIRVGKLRKTFIVMLGKERKTVTIGHYPDDALKSSRLKAKVLLTQSTWKGGNAPQNALQRFIRDATARLKRDTVAQYEYYLSKLNLDLDNLTRDAIDEKLSLFEGTPHAQNYAYAAARVYLNWCLEHEYIDKHPLMRGKLPNKTRSRDRVLSDEELARIWRCTEDDTYGRILKLLILTGQRRMEVRNLTPSDIQDGYITFHTKGDRVNILPITPLIEENLVVPFKFNNWGNAKARFDTDCRVDFRHHDLRRTFATRLASLGVSVVVIERLLGHSFGGKVYQTYQRHTFLPEAKEALLTWENHIRSITTPGH